MGWTNAGGWSGHGWGRAVAGGASTTTWNPSDAAASITLSNGNLTATLSSSAESHVRSIANHSTGKYFYSVKIGQAAANTTQFGVANSTFSLTVGYLGSDINGIGFTATSGNVYFNGGAIGTGSAWGAANDVIDIAFDVGGTLLWTRVNGGNWNNNVSADPATGSGGFSFSGLTGSCFAIMRSNASGDNATANFGGSAYTYAAPSGFGNL